MDIYLAGAPVDRLFGEVTCGDVGVQGVKVIVPSDRYDSLIARLAAADTTAPWTVWQMHRFLAFRCDREFLTRYIGKYPEFVSGLRVGSYLYAVSDVNVLVRLAIESPRIGGSRPQQQFGNWRSRRLTLAFFLNEFANYSLRMSSKRLEDIRTKLLPDLDSTISNWRGNYDENRNEDPENHFDELVSALKEFRDELTEHPEAVNQIESALSEIKEVVDELRSDQPQEPDSDDFRGRDL